MDVQQQIGWAKNPRSGKKQFTWRLVRTPSRGKLDFIVLSPQSLGCFTHFIDGRTQPHRLANCPCENTSIRLEYHAYVAAQEVGTLRQLVVEFTERVDGIVLDWLARHRTLRGCHMRMSRMGQSKCGKIFVEIAEQASELPKSTPTANLQEILAHIWKLHTVDLGSLEIHPPRIMEPAPEESPDGVVVAKTA